MGDPDCRARALRVAKDLGLVDMPADPEDEDRRQQADRKESAPGHRLGEKSIEPSVNERRSAPADGPSGLHHTDSAAAVLVTDDLAHHHRAGRPLTTETQPVQSPQGKQLLEILGEGAEEGEDGVPQDRDLQHAYAAEPVSERAREPPAQRRNQQSNRADQTRFAAREPPTAITVGITRLYICTSNASKAQPPKQPPIVRRSLAFKSVSQASIAFLRLTAGCCERKRKRQPRLVGPAIQSGAVLHQRFEHLPGDAFVLVQPIERKPGRD